ncbi:MAG: hypothetical protein ACK56I_19670, partial [bacterium]
GQQISPRPFTVVSGGELVPTAVEKSDVHALLAIKKNQRIPRHHEKLPIVRDVPKLVPSVPAHSVFKSARLLTVDRLGIRVVGLSAGAVD